MSKSILIHKTVNSNFIAYIFAQETVNGKKLWCLVRFFLLLFSKKEI